MIAPAAETHSRPRAPSTEAIEDYAKTIYALAQRQDGLVGNGEVAERLGVSPTTATAMLKRLDGLGLVEYTPYKGVVLTEAGERVALEVMRHHRLIESYLAEALGMPWDQVHEEAEVLEHYISENLEALIAAKLGEPSHDPHGDPIPGPDLMPPVEDASQPLSELEPGASATFTRVSDSDPAMLRYLDERGIRPGKLITAIERQPFGGPLVVEVDGQRHSLGGELLRRVRIASG